MRVKEETLSELLPEISKSREAAADYLISVNRLGAVKPDFWLPAVATDGRKPTCTTASGKTSSTRIISPVTVLFNLPR